jgi:hypothetical protein
MKFLKIVLISLLIITPNILVAQTLGTNTQIPEGTCITSTAGTDILCGNSADHQPATSANAAGIQNMAATFFLANNYTNATTSFTSVTALAFPVNMNRSYHATCHIIWSANTTIANPKYQWTGPNSSTLTLATNLFASVTLTSFANAFANTYSTTIVQTSAVLASTTFIDTIEFALANGANKGTVQLQAAAQGAGTVTILAGSSCVVQ